VTRYNLSALNIVVVDDSRHMLRLFHEVLSSFGVRQIRCFPDAAAAFAEICQTPPDIVVTDWRMEPVSGVELVRMLRQSDDSICPFVPIVAVTGHTDLVTVKLARDVGVTEFLAKPISPRSLYERLVTIIERPRTFVRTSSYVGPDRRRRLDSFYGGIERRAADDDEARHSVRKTG